MRALAVLTVRNEGAFLLEWMAHHRAVGFTDILAFSNDCDDGTDAMLDRLAALGWLTHVRNDGPHPQGPQWTALKAADRHTAKAAADWVMVLDIDEFLAVAAGDGTLSALLAAVPDADAIALTWRMFGNAGADEVADTALRHRFTACAPRVLHWPWTAVQIKTLFRNNGTFGKLGVHRPRNPDPERSAKWVDGSGNPLPEGFGRLFHGLGTDPYALAQVNHYALGAMQDFVLKADRGRPNRKGAPPDMDYWVERNFSAVEDRTVLRLDPRVAPLLDELRADPVLGVLHRAALDWRRARVAALLAEEHWRQLYGRLMLAGPTRILTAAEARRVWSRNPRS